MKEKSSTIIFIIVIYIINFSIIRAQDNVLSKRISLRENEYTVSSILNFLLLEKEINLSFSNEIVTNNAKIMLTEREYSVQEILNEIYRQTGIEYILRDGIIALRVKQKMDKYTISGIVKDSLTGETIPNTSVFIQNTTNGIITNEYGFYSLKVTEGNQAIVFSFLGYQTKTICLKISKDARLNVELLPITVGINEIFIKSNISASKAEQRLSKIDLKKIREFPNLGEPDLLQSIRLLPGVTSMGEVGRGFNVRGGTADQNLIMLDEAIVYNASHMEGFYSVFNSDIIKDVKFYKSEIPAKYGGRLSSVIDITQKEGNMKKFHGKGGIGLIASKLMLEGPVFRDKASFILAARRSYVDMFFSMVPEDVTWAVEDVKIHFYDINAKLNYIINDNNRIYISAYHGDDVLKTDNYNQKYGNLTATLRYNHIFNNKLFSNTSVIYSDYNMVNGELSEYRDWEGLTGIRHYQVKNEFNYYLYKNKVKFGFDGIYRKFYPGEFRQSNNESSSVSIKIPAQQSLESALYLSNVMLVHPKVEIQLGIRFSLFHYLGPEEIYLYQEGIPRNINTITDTVKYIRNKVIQSYIFQEPRISVKYIINEANSVKLSYNKTTQFIHLITNTITPTPYDMWKPANNNIKPLTGHQFAIGYYTSLFDNILEISSETFFKRMYNTLEVKPGADIVLNRTLDAELMEGEGKVYGFEFLLEKIKGKSTGSISYTYSRSFRKIDKIYSNEKILPKDYYPADYDIPHKISLAFSYKTGERSTFSSNFTYMTGRPITLPDGQYIYFGTLLPYYSAKNQHRMPVFHRLDFSFAVQGKKNNKRKWSGHWVFSVYNVYARKNPYSIYLQRIQDTRDTRAMQLSIFGSIVPSISYSFSF